MDGYREWSDSITDDEIIKDALALYKEDEDYYSSVYDEMRDDLRNIIHGGWTDSDREGRDRNGRPCLHVPRINQFLNHVKNGMRNNKPGIKVSPRGAVDEDTQKERVRAAEVRQGLIRAIQYDSTAQRAYQNAFDCAVDMGLGFVRATTEYVSGASFDQDIKIDVVRNPLTVMLDRRRQKIDGSDAKHAFIHDTMRKDVFKAKYPNASDSHWNSTIETDCSWKTGEEVSVVEFYCIWTKKRELYAAETGAGEIVGYVDELDDLPEESRAEVEAAIVRRRTVREPMVKWYKMTRVEILERKDIPGEYIPIVPMFGIDRDESGRPIIKGLTRDLKDSCLLYDYVTTQEAERLTNSQKVLYVGTTEQFKGKESDWGEINQAGKPYVTYNPVSSGGNLVPPPQPVMPAGIDPQIINAKMGYVDDMKSISGISDPALGIDTRVKSGKAINAEKQGSDLANLHFIDNAGYCISHVGKIVNSWLPVYYDTNRIVKILGEELEEDTVELGGIDENTGQKISLGDGEYDVVVTMGASFATKRQEALEFMMELIRVAPQIVPLIYDLLVKNMDTPGAQEISERLKKTIPPEILEEKGGEEQLRIGLQKAMSQIQQDKQIIEILTQQLQEVSQELANENSDRMKDLKIAEINAESKIAVAQINAMAKNEQDTRGIYYKMWENFQNNQNSTAKQAIG